MSNSPTERPELSTLEKLSTIGTLLIVIAIVATVINSVVAGPTLVLSLTTGGLVIGLVMVGIPAFIERREKKAAGESSED